MYNIYLIFEKRFFLKIRQKMELELKVCMLQTDLVWENPAQNRIHFETKIKAIATDVDLIVLPEMCTTGFTMHAQKLAEKMNGISVSWMQQLAKEKEAAIIGSLIISENNKFYNRLLFVHPSGKIDPYDKRHSFTLAKEHEVYTPGNNKLIVTYKGWKICPFICYDLRFPVWSRNSENYDVLVYVASWPKPRITAWTSLLQARAIENMAYTIGVNRVGEDLNGHEYPGHSAIFDCLGNQLASFKEDEEGIARVTFMKSKQDTIRKKLNFLNDKDPFEFV
jgi:predicted amidohydrolase